VVDGLFYRQVFSSCVQFETKFCEILYQANQTRFQLSVHRRIEGGLSFHKYATRKLRNAELRWIRTEVFASLHQRTMGAHYAIYLLL